ncbi:MAG: LuxR C-terminal-related transcriptional regulator [Roseovarius sp.]|jgi:DNA-binding CsgD family transcriptional regulator|uniref:response regulator transcription factor n=1 Tax=Roseovarius sp. TaxID=1486281 RepID=UPI0032EF02BB
MTLRDFSDAIHPRFDPASRDGSQGLASPAINPVIVFIGNCVIFTDRLMQLVDAEFLGVSVLRLDGLRQLNGLPEERHAMVRLIVVDEAIAQNANEELTVTAKTFSSTTIGLAYISAESAKQILAGPAGPIVGMRCLPMQAPIDAWLAALHLMLLGQHFVPCEILATAQEQHIQPDPEPSEANDIANACQSKPSKLKAHNAAVIAKLTAREFQIMDFIAKGERNKTIARLLGLSEHTIKLHVHNIFGKIGVDNRTSAARWYLSKNAQLEIE